MMENNTRIGFIGTGMMGEPMAGRLIDAGYPINVWNRTPHKADRLVDRGAVRAASIAELSHNNTVIISMVADSSALTDLAEGDADIISNLPVGSVYRCQLWE
jgi:3-hydroxyisobutyrate dehydrogenase